MTSEAQQIQDARGQRIARLLDRAVMPVWHQKFATALWRHLPEVSDGLVLDLHCGSGHTTRELLERLTDAKVVGLEPNESLRQIARSRMTDAWGDRVYLRSGDLSDVVDIDDETYDLVVANLVLGEAFDRMTALRNLRRITKTGGTVLVTLPMDGSWTEAEHLFREVLIDAGLVDAAHRLDRIARLRPSGSALADAAIEAGVGKEQFIIEQERFLLLFASGREFLFSPLVEFGPLPLWRAIVGEPHNQQAIFWRFKEAIDNYYADHAFAVSITVGLLRICVAPSSALDMPLTAEFVKQYWNTFPQLDTLWRNKETEAATRDAFEVEIDLDDTAAPFPGVPTPTSTPPHPVLKKVLTDEDKAILAVLERPENDPRENELDSLLDQVLEFAPPRDDIEELREDEFEELPSEPTHRPGETLKRIRALLPPPPVLPPPPPTKKSDNE